MTYRDLDDTQLLQKLQEDQHDALAEIYNRYWKLLYVIACNIIHDENFAKDAVQEVFIALWQRRANANIQVLKPYLQQAVRFQVLKLIRAQKTNEQFCSRLVAVTADIVYHNPLLFKEQETLLRAIMEGLPDDYRLVFKLSREEQLTYKQIAHQLNISEKTVEKKMSACLKQIRHALQQSKILSATLAFVLSQIH